MGVHNLLTVSQLEKCAGFGIGGRGLFIALLFLFGKGGGVGDFTFLSGKGGGTTNFSFKFI